jgi:hypothetical protein
MLAKRPIHRLPAEDRVGFAIALALFVAVSLTGVLWATRNLNRDGRACASVSCRLLGAGL